MSRCAWGHANLIANGGRNGKENDAFKCVFHFIPVWTVLYVLVTFCNIITLCDFIYASLMTLKSSVMTYLTYLLDSSCEMEHTCRPQTNFRRPSPFVCYEMERKTAFAPNKSPAKFAEIAWDW